MTYFKDGGGGWVNFFFFFVVSRVPTLNDCDWFAYVFACGTYYAPCACRRSLHPERVQIPSAGITDVVRGPTGAGNWRGVLCTSNWLSYWPYWFISELEFHSVAQASFELTMIFLPPCLTDVVNVLLTTHSFFTYRIWLSFLKKENKMYFLNVRAGKIAKQMTWWPDDLSSIPRKQAKMKRDRLHIGLWKWEA